MQRRQDGSKDRAAESTAPSTGKRQTVQQQPEDKCVYWEAQVDWWERWASDHGLSLDATSGASIHLSFMQGLATQAARELRAAHEAEKATTLRPPTAKKN